MSRITPVGLEDAQGQTKELLEGLNSKLGKVPNIFKNMAASPAVLSGYMGLSQAASQASLDGALREKIALVVGQENNCNYCLAAHTAIAGGLGVSQPDILAARRAESEDSKTKAILAFTKSVVANKAAVSDEEVATLKSAGVSDQELVEIVLVISQNLFTNYFNHIIDPEIDFPEAPGI